MNITKTLIAGAVLVSGLGLIAAPSASADTGPYGKDTCKQGFVWREAMSNDHVCVSPEQRSQAALDNSLSAEREEPNGGAWGPHTCRQGFVWRVVVANDLVCVTPATRDRVAADNAVAAQRVQG
ncbi:MAG: hypothetical protein EOP32_01560 [Rhodococcus sp. (in: high G+C Gram-positive bacteria)]|nr:MAG: hypothetical protein EOP32_01560 [Rhodococcus sp. (in: high G+C Gram-positive bacteria)]